MASDRYGIDDRFHDAHGVEHVTSPETRAALLAAMGIDPQVDAPPTPGSEDSAVRVLVPGHVDRALAGPAELVLEDGTSLAVDGELPATLPFGYHQLRPRNGGAPTLLIVSPGRCFLPDDLRVWGFAAQLYAPGRATAGGSATWRIWPASGAGRAAWAAAR